MSRGILGRRGQGGRPGRHAQETGPEQDRRPEDTRGAEGADRVEQASPVRLRSVPDFEEFERRELRSRTPLARDRSDEAGPEAGGPDPDWWRPIVVDRPMHEFEPRPPLAGNFGFIPDTVFDGWSSDCFTVRLAAVRGASHRYRAQPRQDHVEAFCLSGAESGSEAVIFAVADGVSNAAHGELGSLFAVRGAIQSMREQLADGGTADWRAVLEYAVSSMKYAAEHHMGVVDLSARELGGLMATTLVCGVIRSTEYGCTVALARAGDSGAWVLGGHGYDSVFEPKRSARGDVVSTAVRALPHIPARVQESRFELAPHAALLVGTDGFGDPLGDGTGEIGALFARWLAEPPAPRGFAQLLDFSRDTFDDDRALVAIWPRPRPRLVGTQP